LVRKLRSSRFKRSSLCVSAVFLFNRKGAKGTSKKCICTGTTVIILLLFLCVSAVFFFNRKGAKGTAEKCICTVTTVIILLLFLCVSAVFYLTAKALRELRRNASALESKNLFS
jgi:hypothetical protein